MELLMAMMMMTVLLTMSSQFLVTSFRLSTEGSVQANMQNQAVVAVHKMLLDLQRTNAAGLTRHPEGFGVVGVSTLTSLRSLVWDTKQIVYFRDPTSRKVYSKWWPPGQSTPPTPFDPSEVPRITPAMLEGMMLARNGTERLLATDVESLTLEGTSGIETMALKMVCSLDVRGHIQRFELTRVVGLRNHL